MGTRPMIHYFCGTCGVPYLAAVAGGGDRRLVRAEPQCLKEHPLCIQIGTEEEARIKRKAHIAKRGSMRRHS